MKVNIAKWPKRAVAAILAVLLAITFLPFSSFNLVTAKAEDTLPAPATAKKLHDNGDGTYTLSLSVTGAAESSSTTQVTKANVVLVMDTSNSMNQSSGTTTPYEYTEHTGPGQQGVQYWGTDGDGEYYRVYYRNQAWRTSNSNWGTVYNGTVYTRSGGAAISRIEAEKDALTKDDGIIDNLLSQNVTGDPTKSDIIEVAVVNFGTRGHDAQDFTTNATTLKNTINNLTTSTGTNWEEALQHAKTYADSIKASQPNEDVYIIFLTDGEPTTHYNSYNVNTNYAQEWGYASDDARGLVTAGYKFYALFTWGSGNSSHYLSSLVQFAYTGSGNSSSQLQPAYQQYFTDASDTETLIEALNQIVHDITESVGYTNVELEDGVTSMTTSSVKTTASGDVTGLKYYRSGGSYGTANPDAGQYGTEWAEAPPATINSDGEVDWNLGDIVLEDGVTYTVTFVVWPSQESIDLVADLNNHVITLDDLTEDQRSQIAVSGGHYSLKTNTDYPTVTYSTVTTTTVDGVPTTVVSDPISTTIANPDPVGLAEDQLKAIKGWEDTLDPNQREEIKDVTLYLLVDGHYYYVDAEGNPLGVTLTEESDWTVTDYIAIAPGLMVTETSPAYDPNAPHFTWEGTTYAMLETGHEYVFEESDINGHFELTAYTHHPMIMGSDSDGNPIIKDVTFTKDASGNITGIEAVAAMGDNLSATNTLKGGINITKKVVDVETGEEINDTNPFTITVTVTDPEGGALPTKKASDGTEYTIDYRIYYGPNNPAYENSGEQHRSDHIYVPGTSFEETIYVGDTIRVVNVEDDSLYTVEETVPEGYDSNYTVDYSVAYGTGNPEPFPEGEAPSVQGNSASYAEITNQKLIEVTVNKVWDDANNQEGLRPETLELTLNGNGVPVVNPPAPTITKSEDGNTWTYTWSGLPKIDASGEVIIYTVSEDDVPEGYIKTPNDPVSDGGTITNKYNLTDISVDKYWDDNSDQDGIRPGTLALTLNGVPAGTNVPTPEITPSEDGNTLTYTWSGLPKYDASTGEPITYTVSEDDVPEGYIKTPEDPVPNGETITNSHTPETKILKVVKEWDDNDDQDLKRPTTLNVTLMAGEEEVTTFELTEDNDWSATTDPLPVYEDGEEITYSWVEDEDSLEELDYSLTDTDESEEETEEGEVIYVTTLTNTLDPETKLLQVKKVWNDNNDQDGVRPDSLTVKLMAGEDEVTTVELTADDNWTSDEIEVPVHAAGGVEITYTWVEDETGLPEGYEFDGSSVSGNITTLTNKYTPQTKEVSVKKVWEDNNDRLGVRPDSLTVKLMAGEGEEKKLVTTVVLNEDNEWTSDEIEVPVNAGGDPITYTWEETEPLGYKLTDTSTDETTGLTTLTNEIQLGDLTITKDLTKYNDFVNQTTSTDKTIDKVTFIYRITVTLDTWKYEDYISLTFDTAGSDSIVFEDAFPVGAAVTLIEVYTGAGYFNTDEYDPDRTWTGEITDGEESPAAVANFTNAYDNKIIGGYGIENTYVGGQHINTLLR